MVNQKTNLTLSPQKAQEIMKRADTAMAKLQKIRGKTEEKVGEVFKMIETVGGALAVGYARARFGEVTIGSTDIPVEALVGAGLSLTAFLDLPGKYSEHLHNVGNGILGGWGTMEAIKLGGGIVLSKQEYENLRAPAVMRHEVAQQEDVRALNGTRQPSAREGFGQTVGQKQEVEKSSS